MRAQINGTFGVLIAKFALSEVSISLQFFKKRNGPLDFVIPYSTGLKVLEIVRVPPCAEGSGVCVCVVAEEVLLVEKKWVFRKAWVSGHVKLNSLVLLVSRVFFVLCAEAVSFSLSLFCSLLIVHGECLIAFWLRRCACQPPLMSLLGPPTHPLLLKRKQHARASCRILRMRGHCSVETD